MARRCLLSFALLQTAAGLAPVPRPRAATRRRGMFDFIADAFKNEQFDDRRATARHILVKTLDECDSVMGEIAQGMPFADAAAKFASATAPPSAATPRSILLRPCSTTSSLMINPPIMYLVPLVSGRPWCLT